VVTPSLEDLLAYARLPTAGKSETTKSDRESDLTSPGSVRSAISEFDSSHSKSEETEVVEKLSCHYTNCNKTFDRANLLKRHLKMHSGESRFVCDVCKKWFESNSKLEDHYRRHTGERPFQCHVCGNKFRYKGDRTKHLKNLHGVYKSQDTVSNGTIPEMSAQDISGTTGKLLDDKFLSSSRSNSTNSSVVSSMELDPPTSSTDSTGKFDPLDVSVSNDTTSTGLLPARLLSCSLPQETVTMSLDDVLQYAQPVADYTF